MSKENNNKGTKFQPFKVIVTGKGYGNSFFGIREDNKGSWMKSEQSVKIGHSYLVTSANLVPYRYQDKEGQLREGKTLWVDLEPADTDNQQVTQADIDQMFS